MNLMNIGVCPRVDCGPVVASAALQLTQSAVTRRVHNLEDETLVWVCRPSLCSRRLQAQRHMSSRDQCWVLWAI
jgi:hypothetical protein